MATLEDHIRRLKAEGKSAIECQKWLRDNKMIVPWVEVRKVYQKV